MAEREIEKWVTINGHHVPIYKDEAKPTPSDSGEVDGKDYDGEIPEVVNNNRPGKYTRMLENNTIDEVVWEFYKATEVNVDLDARKIVDPENLGMVMDTIADIKDKYDCKITGIVSATDDLLEKTPDAYAWMGQNGYMYLNPRYFSKTKEQLELDYAHNTPLDKRGYHPPSPYGARSIISHEMGHAVFNRYIQNIMNQEDIQEDFGAWTDHWTACNKFVTDEYASREREIYIASPGYKQLVDTFQKLGDELNNDPYMIKRWGGKPNISLLALADVNFNFDDAVSEYAGTNYHEMIAEAFADVYDNGANASFTSKFLYDRIIKEMKK